MYVEVLFFKIYFYLFSLQLAVWLMGYYLSILFSCEALTFLQIENLKNKLQQYQLTLSQNSMIRILFQNLSQRQQKNRKRAIKLEQFKKKIQTLLLGYVNLSYFNHFSILFHKKKKYLTRHMIGQFCSLFAGKNSHRVVRATHPSEL